MLVHYQLENNGCRRVKPGVRISLIATESTEGNKNDIQMSIVSFRVFPWVPWPYYPQSKDWNSTRLNLLQESLRKRIHCESVELRKYHADIAYRHAISVM